MNDFPSEMKGPPEDPRVRFAAERTLLAWMRTGLALMGFGFVVARFGLFLHEIALAGNIAAHQQLADLIRRYNVNDYAASVRVFAIKPN